MNQETITISTAERGDEQRNLLGHILKIREIVPKNNTLDLDAAAPHISALEEKLRISPIQAALFSFVLDTQGSSPVSLDDIARNIDVPKLMLLQYKGEFDALVEKRLLRTSSAGALTRQRRRSQPLTPSYIAPRKVIDCLTNNETWQPAARTNLSEDEFFEEMNDLFEARVDQELNFALFRDDLFSLITENQHLDAARKLKGLPLDADALVLLAMFCNAAACRSEKIGRSAVTALYDQAAIGRQTWSALEEGTHPLQELHLIENANSDGFRSVTAFVLTQKAQEDLLGSLAFKTVTKKNINGLIECGAITPKDLFYNNDEQEKINRLVSLLREENFRQVQERLVSGGMRTGFACLFSGGPGTGKTETVMQTARLTGRDIFKVEISETKSKWFGESEQLVKGIFNTYRDLVNNAEKRGQPIPILLFNEADGVFSKRRTLSTERLGPDQTENAIQNIILEEMENLNGILIATTNMTNNLDSAFERRFLYKIEFPKPRPETRAAIWRTMIAGLAEPEAGALAAAFDLSGGQIENVARKHAIDTILSGQPPSLDTMMALCREETIAKDKSRPIGFCA